MVEIFWIGKQRAGIDPCALLLVFGWFRCTFRHRERRESETRQRRAASLLFFSFNLNRTDQHDAKTLVGSIEPVIKPNEMLEWRRFTSNSLIRSIGWGMRMAWCVVPAKLVLIFAMPNTGAQRSSTSTMRRPLCSSASVRHQMVLFRAFFFFFIIYHIKQKCFNSDASLFFINRAMRRRRRRWRLCVILMAACDFCNGQKTNVKSLSNRIYRRCTTCKAVCLTLNFSFKIKHSTHYGVYVIIYLLRFSICFSNYALLWSSK